MMRLLILLPLMAACAPVPMTAERATQLCTAEAGQADGISGSIGAGISSDGPRAGGQITVTNRILNPQSEEDFIAACIDRRMAGRPAPTTFGISAGTGS